VWPSRHLEDVAPAQRVIAAQTRGELSVVQRDMASLRHNVLAAGSHWHRSSLGQSPFRTAASLIERRHSYTSTCNRRSPDSTAQQSSYVEGLVYEAMHRQDQLVHALCTLQVCCCLYLCPCDSTYMYACAASLNTLWAV
jgi:hypothetical protein